MSEGDAHTQMWCSGISVAMVLLLLLLVLVLAR
jgi:hypothetical protein